MNVNGGLRCASAATGKRGAKVWARFQLVQAACRDGGLSLIKYPSITSQACSASVIVLNGEPMTLMAGLF